MLLNNYPKQIATLYNLSFLTTYCLGVMLYESQRIFVLHKGPFDTLLVCGKERVADKYLGNWVSYR